MQHVTAYNRHEANIIVGETNNGRDLVEMNLKAVDTYIPFKTVHASRAKAIRAEPISALYEQGRVHYFGTFPQLEDQVVEWVPGTEKLPDRIDVFVYALSVLSLNTYAGSDFETPACVTSRSQEVGFSKASLEGFEDIWQDNGY